MNRYWSNTTNRPKKLDVLMPDGKTMFFSTWVQPQHSFMPPQTVLDHINRHPDSVRWDPEDPPKQYEVWLEDGPLDGEKRMLDLPPGAKVVMPYVDEHGTIKEHVYQRWGVVGEAELFQYVEPPEPEKGKGGAFQRMLDAEMKRAMEDYKEGLKAQLERSHPFSGLKDLEKGGDVKVTWAVKKGDVPDKPHPFGRN